MLLSAADIKRIEKKGFSKDLFTRFDSDGYAMLRNRQGKCVFFDDKKRACKIYSFRPSGCRIYPVMQDEEKGIVLDEICPAQNSISPSEQAIVGKRVLKLLERIDSEAQKLREKK